MTPTDFFGALLCSVDEDQKLIECPFVFKSKELYEEHEGCFFDDLIELFPEQIDDAIETVRYFDPSKEFIGKTVFVDFDPS